MRMNDGYPRPYPQVSCSASLNVEWLSFQGYQVLKNAARTHQDARLIATEGSKVECLGVPSMGANLCLEAPWVGMAPATCWLWANGCCAADRAGGILAQFQALPLGEGCIEQQ